VNSVKTSFELNTKPLTFELFLFLPFAAALFVFYISFRFSSKEEKLSGRTAIASLINIAVGIALCYYAALSDQGPGTDIIIFYSGVIFAGSGVLGIVTGFVLSIIHSLCKKRTHNW
jgi:uncharacterized membrane protein HdeD (DUF308 family)